MNEKTFIKWREKKAEKNSKNVSHLVHRTLLTGMSKARRLPDKFQEFCYVVKKELSCEAFQCNVN